MKDSIRHIAVVLFASLAFTLAFSDARAQSSLSGTVYLDEDRDGFADVDPGLKDVPIFLFWESEAGPGSCENQIVDRYGDTPFGAFLMQDWEWPEDLACEFVLTDDDGDYEFDALPPDDYIITENPLLIISPDQNEVEVLKSGSNLNIFESVIFTDEGVPLVQTAGGTADLPYYTSPLNEIGIIGLDFANDYADLDFGDAPDDYPTLLENNGARHMIELSELWLGGLVDAEDDGQPDDEAGAGDEGGDDNTGVDDEDGVTFTLSKLITVEEGATTASVEVSVSAAGYLQGWIDFNADDDWYDTGEQIFENEYLEAGTNLLQFEVPLNSTPGLTFARFRIATNEDVSVTGLAYDGEVEDYQVEIAEGNGEEELIVNLPSQLTNDPTLKVEGGNIVLEGSTILSIPLGAIGSLIINGSANDETLVIDFTGGNPIPSGGVTFNGNGGDDAIEMNDTDPSQFSRVDHVFTNEHDGRIDLHNGSVSVVNYTGLAPIFDNLVVADRLFSFGGGAQDVELLDDVDPNNGKSFIDSDGSEEVTFANPTNSLTVDLGGGADMLDVDRMDNGFEADLIIDGKGGSDVITVNNVYKNNVEADVTINGGDGGDTVSLLANKLPKKSTHAVNGEGGSDDILLRFEDGKSIPTAAGTALTIDGGNPSLFAAPDVLTLKEVNTKQRTVNITYNDDASSDVTITGFGTNAGISAVNLEKIKHEGDGDNDDEVTVKTLDQTAPDKDVVTVEPTGANSANVFFNGTPFATPGVEDGAPGPDLELSGLVSTCSPTCGLSLDGGDPTTMPGDELHYDGMTDINFEVSSPTTGIIKSLPGILEVFYTSFENHYSKDPAIVNIVGTSGNDDFLVKNLTAGSPVEVVVTVNGVGQHKHKLEDLAAIIINAGDGNDHLEVDFGNGNPIPEHGLFYNGEGQNGGGGDDVELNNGFFDTITHTFANKKDGTVEFDDTSDQWLLTYTGLEPITDNLDANNRIFDFSGADDNVTLDWLTSTINYGVISTSGPPTSETVVFPYPFLTLTVNGNGGDDAIVSEGLSGDFKADLFINGNDGDDTITMNQTLGSGAYEVNGGAGDDVITTFATQANLIASYLLTGGDGDDLFNVEPDFVEVVVMGGDPTFPTFPGDRLDVDVAAGMDPSIVMSGLGAGEWTFSDRQKIAFSEIEGLVDVADLKIRKKVDNAAPLVGEEVTYSVTVTNKGETGHAFDVSVVDILPPGLEFVSADPSAAYKKNTGVWTVGDIPKGESATLLLTAKLVASTVITNTASVASPPGYAKYPKTASDEATIVPYEQTTVWRNANREAGTITSLAFKSSLAKDVSGIIFAGSDGGGVFRSLDGGENWYPAGTTSLGDATVRDLEVSLQNGALWAAAYRSGAWRSTDDGETFTRLFKKTAGVGSNDVLAVAVNTFNPKNGSPADDGDVFLGTDGDGIFYSDDNGLSFADISTGLPNLRVMDIFIEEKGAGGGRDRIWVATYGGGVFYKDYVAGPVLGAGWTAVNGSAANPLVSLFVRAVVFDGLGNLYAGTNGGIFRSTNDGGAWELVLEGKTDEYDTPIVVRTFLTLESGGTHFIWAGTDGDYIYRSMYQGGAGTLGDPKSWKQETGFPALSGTSGLRSATIYDMLHIDGTLFVGTEDEGIHRSSSLGEWWNQVSAEVLNPVVQAMDFSSNGKKLYAGTYGWGVMMTDDFDGSTFVNWTRTNNGLGNHWVYALAVKDDGPSDLVFAGTWGGGVYRSDDEGEIWHFSGLPSGIVRDLLIGKDGTIFAALENGSIARSIDDGFNWQTIGVAATSIWSLAEHPSPPAGQHILYAGTGGQGIYVSFDGGLSWARTELRDSHVFDMEFDVTSKPKPTLYAATAVGIIGSMDDFTTWSDLSTGLTVPETRTLSIIATSKPGKPLMTAGTWGGGVFTYRWDVDSWIRDGLGQAPIVAFAISPETRDGFVSTNEGGLYRKLFPAAATATSVVDPASDLPAEIALAQNYPNPFNPQTVVDFALPETEAVRITVYDALGRSIRVLVDNVLPAGRHSVTFEAANLPSGAYFYQLQAGSTIINRKMVLMK